MIELDWREAFRRRIAAAGYSPRSLSLAAGLNPTAIRDILQGRSRRPRYQTLYRIAQVLGTTPKHSADRHTRHSVSNLRTWPTHVRFLWKNCSRIRQLPR